MTTLEIVLSVACVVLAVLFVLLCIAGAKAQEAYESMREECQYWETSAHSAMDLVHHYERREKERRKDRQ